MLILLLFMWERLQSIVMSMSVCVCLFVTLSLEPRVQSLPNFFACCLWPWLGPPLAGWWNPNGKWHLFFGKWVSLRDPEQWQCSAAGKVTVGLASHQPFVTLWGISTCRFSVWGEGYEYLAYTALRSMSQKQSGDQSGRKGRDGQKNKIGKANEKREKVNRAKDEEVNRTGREKRQE